MLTVFKHKCIKLMPQNKHSLGRSGSFEHHHFCKCFDIVVVDESINPWQLDTLNILDPWQKVCAIDEDEMVKKLCRQVKQSIPHNLNKVFPHPPLFPPWLTEMVGR